MLEIFFNDETGQTSDRETELISKLLAHAAEQEGIKGETELSVTFMTDEEIREVNSSYRGKDVPTDVISFALEEMSVGEVAIIYEEGMPKVLGDIIISVETASRQAKNMDMISRGEIGFLALHGFLHLLGYDHMR